MAYTALLNAFFLSLVALLPQTNLGWAALILSLIGLANHFMLGWNLSRHSPRRWLSIVRRAALIVAALLLYGYELYNAILLLLSPTTTTAISVLAPLLVGIYALDLTRAWHYSVAAAIDSAIGSLHCTILRTDSLAPTRINLFQQPASGKTKPHEKKTWTAG